MLSAKFRIATELLDLIEGYRRLISLLRKLGDVIPIDSWHRLPSSEADGTGKWQAIADEENYLRRLARDMDQDAARWPGTADCFATTLTTACDAATWESTDRAVLKISPRQGLISLQWLGDYVSEIKEYERSRASLQAICDVENVLFACADRPLSTKPDGAAGRTSYCVHFRAFPHREFLGWMGFVKGAVSSSEVPEADELIAIPKRGGTLVVAVAGGFDIHNPAHVQQAQRVEMRLVDLDLLPVTGPRFF